VLNATTILLIWTHKILGVTCDNATANDVMIESMATIMSNFGSEANRVRCLAHIVNLVVKIILRQFDVSTRKEKEHDSAETRDDAEELKLEDDDELVRVLDKEEKEMDEGDVTDDEDYETLARDVEMIEEVMEEEIKEASMLVKPVRQVLFKVGTAALRPWIPRCFCFLFLLPSIPF
jgi:hypothetical protein